MSSTTFQVSALVAITIFMIVSLCSLGAVPNSHTEVATIATAQLNG